MVGKHGSRIRRFFTSVALGLLLSSGVYGALVAIFGLTWADLVTPRAILLALGSIVAVSVLTSIATRIKLLRVHADLLRDGMFLPRAERVHEWSYFNVHEQDVKDPSGNRPYFRRNSDEELREAVREARFILVDGPPKAGKSFAAAKAVQAVWPGKKLLIPAKPNSPAELLNGGLPLRNTVLWLDGFHRHLDHET
ncbi:hypothetical protein [Nonomuraea diastatica]|uniref:Uncharacterized protein n=1 Tax=Nonomuraea diastatica TaxID=1848329 RepID=A0A4R4X615_9ACTN|nr:hypothetical protein [Nonomuraea diastatica]TDD25774.1 hypothetical protein E1294_02360 [Nonomuraea diastatica]